MNCYQHKMQGFTYEVFYSNHRTVPAEPPQGATSGSCLTSPWMDPWTDPQMDCATEAGQQLEALWALPAPHPPSEKHPRARAFCPGGSGSVSTCFGAVVRPASAGTGQSPSAVQPPRAHIPAAQSRPERALCPPPSWSPHLGCGQRAPCWATPA